MTFGLVESDTSTWVGLFFWSAWKEKCSEGGKLFLEQGFEWDLEEKRSVSDNVMLCKSEYQTNDHRPFPTSRSYEFALLIGI